MSVEVAAILLLSNLATLIVSTLFYISRCDDLRRDQQTLIDSINREHRMIQRIQAQVRVEDLLGRTEEM